MTKTVNTRGLVLEVLLSVIRDGEFLNLVLRDVLDKYAYLDKRDRSFISRVCHGCVERMPELDGIINQFSKVTVRKMKPVIHCILLSAVYQILYMDSVPNHAAVDEAVKLAGKKGFANLRGFVNGVLRNIERNREKITYPKKQDFTEYMEKKYSIPVWMCRLWQMSMSDDQIEDIGKAFLTQGPTCVRVMTDKVKPEELIKRLREQKITVEQHKTREDVLYLSDYDSLMGIEEFREGFFYVQDISSMEVATVIAPKAGEVGIDVCSAPGGKSIHAAMLMALDDKNGEKPGKIYARDISPAKISLIRDNIARTGIKHIEVSLQDATVLDESMVNKADFVIADLPCSGLGVMGKKPDIKFHTDEEKVKELAALQAQMLNVVCRYVKDGGRMVYSTCTINRLENEDNVSKFLTGHPEFQLIKQVQMLPEGGKQDGFFYALLKKGE